MAHARRKAAPTQGQVCTEPRRAAPAQQPANQEIVGPQLPGSTTPVLDQANRQAQAGGGGTQTSKLSAADATTARLAKELNQGRTGSVDAWLKVGISRNLGKLASVSLEFGLKLGVVFDNDRRVRATVGFDLTFGAAVDLLLFKAGLSFNIGATETAVWNSPEHFYAYLQGRIQEAQKAADTYLSKKAGTAGKDEKPGGTQAPKPAQDGTPSMGVSTQSMGVDFAAEKGKLLKKVPWLKYMRSSKWEHFTAHRTKPDGTRQELNGSVVRGIHKLDTALGKAEFEYSYTDNHPNPDQNGVFWDLRVDFGEGGAPKVDPKQLAALKAQMKGWSEGTGKDPIKKAKAWLKAAGKALEATKKAPKPKLNGSLGHTVHVHVQWNGKSDGDTLRFIHVHVGQKAELKGELPLGAATLSGEVGIHAKSEVMEILGTQTLLYTKNVYNGFKRRKDHPKGWNAWAERQKTSLWTMFGQVNVPGTQPSKEAKARLKAAAGQNKAALAKRQVDDTVFQTLLGAAARDFEQEGNEADWKDVVDPKKKVTATATVSGSAGKKATYGSVKIRGGRLIKKPKTLRDVHDQGVEMHVEIPQLKSSYRGSFAFDGKQPTFRSDVIRGLKGHFPSRGKAALGAYTEGGIDGLLEGFPMPKHPNDFDRMGELGDRLLDGVIASVVSEG